MSITTPTKKVNYLNNRDILKEIHESKSSYCSFIDKEYHRYDYIINKPEELLETCFDLIMTPEVLAEARTVRATRLSLTSSSKIDSESIPITDLVFRIMTWDHIPIAQKQPRKVVKKKTAKDIFFFDDIEENFNDLEIKSTEKEVDDMVHVKVNFPPFQHFKINEKGHCYLVGKSHWKGDLESGEFSKDHGTVTHKLAKMYMMLCEKYAMKFNWRGYSYVDEMKNSAILQLTYVGLRFNEAKSANPFAYYTSAIDNSFCRVLNSEKKNQNIRDDILESVNLNPSYTRQIQGHTSDD